MMKRHIQILRSWEAEFRKISWASRFFIAGFVCLSIVLLLTHPIPGVAVSFASLAAAIMGIREMGRKQRVTWVLIIAALTIAEISSIRADRETNERERVSARQLELNRFETIAQRMTTSIEQISGGDSYLILTPILVPADGKNELHLRVSVIGKYRVSDAAIYLTKIPTGKGGSRNVQLGRDRSYDPGYSLEVGAIRPEMNGIITEYSIEVMARNGITLQLLKLRFDAVTKRWDYESSVFREIQKDRKSPKVELQPLINILWGEKASQISFQELRRP